MSLKRLFPFIVVLGLGACQTSKRTVYLSQGEGLQNDSMVVLNTPVAPEIRIQPDDILAVTVTSESSLNLESDPVAIYKEGMTTQNIVPGRASSSTNSGYLVDGSGNIEFPVIGKLKLGGLTIQEAKQQMTQLLSSKLKKPVVDVRITNFKVSVVGEVGASGFIIAPNQRMTILEALAAAGDINLNGRKDNVMVIRQNGGKQEIGYIDLTKRSAFNSPYYYLKQNDIINVSPSVVRSQEANTFTRVYLPTFTTLISAVLAVYGLIQITRR
jgi:polysaccharide export outer membrane protein